MNEQPQQILIRTSRSGAVWENHVWYSQSLEKLTKFMRDSTNK